VRGNGTVCALLTPRLHSTAVRVAGDAPYYPSCDDAILTVSGTVRPKIQFTQPVARIFLIHKGRRAGALITFAKPGRPTVAAEPQTEPITIVAVRTSANNWQIDDIDYQF
jgi:hypothetical protein